MFWYIDRYYILLIIPAMLIALFAQMRVQATFRQYSRVYSSRGATAAQVAGTSWTGMGYGRCASNG